MIKKQNNNMTSNLQTELEELNLNINMKGLKPMKSNYEKTETKILKLKNKKKNSWTGTEGLIHNSHDKRFRIKKNSFSTGKTSVVCPFSSFIKEQNKKQKFRNKLSRKVEELGYNSYRRVA